MGLGCQVVHLVRLNLSKELMEPTSVSDVTVVKEELGFGFVWIPVEVIQPRCVEAGCSPNDSVNLILFADEEFREIRTILSGDSCDQSLWHVR